MFDIVCKNWKWPRGTNMLPFLAGNCVNCIDVSLSTIQGYHNGMKWNRASRLERVNFFSSVTKAGIVLESNAKLYKEIDY